MFGVLAVALACVTVLVAIVATVGLTERGNSGQPVFSVFAAVLLVSTLATAVVVSRAVVDEPSPLLAIGAIPPLTILALLIVDRAVLWGNFPPSRTRQVTDRVIVVALFALPAALAALSA